MTTRIAVAAPSWALTACFVLQYDQPRLRCPVPLQAASRFVGDGQSRFLTTVDEKIVIGSDRLMVLFDQVTTVKAIALIPRNRITLRFRDPINGIMILFSPIRHYALFLSSGFPFSFLNPPGRVLSSDSLSPGTHAEGPQSGICRANGESRSAASLFLLLALK
jgi:hypothetical protein